MLLFVGLALASETFDGATYYFGDLHTHTGASLDAWSADVGGVGCPECGSVGTFDSYARSVSGLDFAALTDHTSGAPDLAAWEAALHTVNGMNDEAGGFVTLPGADVDFEVGRSELGAKTILLFGDEATLGALAYSDLLAADPTNNQVADCATISTFMDALTAAWGPALLLPVHPGAYKPIATDWGCFDAGYTPAAQGWSEQGASISEDWGYDEPWSGWDAYGQVVDALDAGLRIGLVGGTDTHDTHPGEVCGYDLVRTEFWYSGALTAVVQDESAAFSRTSIHDALVARQTYLTTGPQLPARVRYSYGGVEQGGMGAAFDGWTVADGDVTVRVTVPEGYDDEVSDVIVHGAGNAAWTLSHTATGEWSGDIPAAEVTPYLLPHLLVDKDAWWGATACDDGYEGRDDGGVEDGVEHVVLSPSFFGAPAGGGDTGADTGSDTGDTGDTASDTGDSATDTGDTAPNSDDTAPDTGDSATDSGDTVSDTGEAKAPGCGCASGGAPAAGIGVLLAAVAAARRRPTRRPLRSRTPAGRR